MKVIENVRGIGHSDSVEAIDAAKKMADENPMEAVLIVCVMQDGSVNTSWGGKCGTPGVIGALEVAKFEFMTVICNQD